MKKSIFVSVPFLAAVAAGCSSGRHVHLNGFGQCVDQSGAMVDQRACSGGGGYYGGTHYVYSGSPASGSTERGVLGSSAEGHGSSGTGVGE